MFQHVVEQHVVGYTPGADHLGARIAVFPYHIIETVAIKETSHIVVVLVVGQKEGGAVTGLVESLRQSAHQRD